MDLASMVVRENFFELFFPTIERYYKEVLGETVECSFAENLRDTNLVCYPWLSGFTMPAMSSKARGFYFREWNIREKPVKSAAVKLYIWGITHSNGLFAKYRLNFQPNYVLNNDMVISPNNRSIRFFDHAEGLVGCIIKQGFTDRYFKNQLNFRLEHLYPFIPQIRDYGSDWFREPIMFGHPLARVTDRDQYIKSVNVSLDDILKIVNDSLYCEECHIYSGRLSETLYAGLKKARVNKNINTYSTAMLIVDHLLDILSRSTQKVPLALSHGDLQTGNIWVDNDGNTWIYDWETVGIRSVWYDPSTLLLSLRKKGGIERLWTEYMYNSTKEAILKNDKKKDYLENEMKTIITIVLLEDIQFYLEDMLELPKDYGKDIFDSYINRLKKLNFDSMMV